MTFTATYSPDDNKLRLYASSRLDRELYERVKAAGFSWAPKQELFVAPAWTPGREDLLLELAGEVDDEDKSLVERAEERADRFEGYHGSRVRDAESAERAVRPILEGRPLGQPILVGHHSERRARKDQERIESGLRRAVTMWDRAEYWTDRAAGALAHAKNKERPDVRARRIKAIEADRRKQEKATLEAQMRIGEWEAVTGHQEAVRIANHDHVSVCFTLEKYPRDHHTYEGWSSLWSGLTDGIIDHEKAREIALRVHARTVERAARWIGHYDNRLAYERAMLAEGGGLAADRFDLQPGGMVLVRGEWATILRVNRVGGQATSVRTNARYCSKVNCEEIRDYRPPTEELAAAVRKATALAPLTNYPHEGGIEMTKAQYEANHRDYRGTRTEPANETHGAHRYRVVYRGMKGAQAVFLTDAKRVEAPKAEGGITSADTPTLPVERIAPRPTYQPTPRLGDEVREALRSGVEVAVADQLFPTPADLAERMADLAGIEAGMRVLEPSAGTGNLAHAIRAVDPEAYLVAVEIDGRLAERLDGTLVDDVVVGDFLGVCADRLGTFDRVVMNPPFANGDDVRHVLHAREMLNPGGRLVAIVAGGLRQERALQPLASEWERLPEGTFKESGTNVSTVLVVIDAPEAA